MRLVEGDGKRHDAGFKEVLKEIQPHPIRNMYLSMIKDLDILGAAS